ncbi:hypothetical protein ACJ41O_003240 [Fusarium nematophilum]
MQKAYESAALEAQADFKHVDEAPSKVSSEENHDHGFTPDEQRKIIRRIDRRLVITVGAMYCVSLMDRTNMSAANIAGMSVELVLTGFRYNIANLVFFIPYILFQPPSTILIRKLGPRIHLAVITMLWGAVMIGMGFVEKFGQLAALRAVLAHGTRDTRSASDTHCFTSSAALPLPFPVSSPTLMQLNGREGLTGWRWIFIIEGVITVALGIAGYWLLVDFPDSKRKSWSFLGQRERDWVVDRIRRDRGDTEVPPFQLGKFLRGGADWKVWAYAMIFFDTTTISYALAYTLPILLVGNMGFTVGQAQCLVAPPYAFAGIVMFATAWVGDKYHIRGPIIVFNKVLCLIGLPIMGWAESANVRYFGVFLVTAGANSNIPAAMAFQANNIRGQWKRAFCSATLVGFGGIGGIAGSLVFREKDKATGYKPGMWTCIACCLLSIILVSLCDLEFKRSNAKADRGEKVLESYDEDASSDFRYTY